MLGDEIFEFLPNEVGEEEFVSVETSIHFRTPQCFEDGLKYDVRLSEDIIVPETEHAEPVRSDKGVATFIVGGLFNMLTSIQLNDDGSFQANEVANVTANRVLAAEFEAAQLSSTQMLPKQALWIGGVFAEVACAPKHSVIWASNAGKNRTERN